MMQEIIKTVPLKARPVGRPRKDNVAIHPTIDRGLNERFEKRAEVENRSTSNMLEVMIDKYLLDLEA